MEDSSKNSGANVGPKRAIKVPPSRQNRKDVPPPDMNFILSRLSFSSQPNELFRVMTSPAEEGLILKIEKKSTQQQWQVTISDLGEHGPTGLPKAAVFEILKAALESCRKEDGSKKIQGEGGSNAEIDLEVGEEGMILVLDVPLFTGFPITYTFELLPLGRDPLDVVEAQLHDAQDEIMSLKGEIKALNEKVVALENTKPLSKRIALRSTSSTSNNAFMSWDQEDHCSDAVLFVKAANHQTITVALEGLYLVNIRVCANDSGNTGNIQLLVDGNLVAQCWSSNPNAYYQNMIINDIIQLAAGATVQVRSVSNQGSTMEQVATNSLSIIKL